MKKIVIQKVGPYVATQEGSGDFAATGPRKDVIRAARDQASKASTRGTDAIVELVDGQGRTLQVWPYYAATLTEDDTPTPPQDARREEPSDKQIESGGARQASQVKP